MRKQLGFQPLLIFLFCLQFPEKIATCICRYRVISKIFLLSGLFNRLKRYQPAHWHVFTFFLIFTFLHFHILAQDQVTRPAKLEPITIEFSNKGGFYNGKVEVEMYCPGAKILYTIDGNYPGKKGKRYRNPITLTKTTVIRAVAYKGKRKSKVISHTYIIDEPTTTFPVVSLSITPEILFHPTKGMYVLGPNTKFGDKKKLGANFWTQKEVSGSCEIFEADGTCVYRNYSGLRIFGGMSRLFPQKSMAIVARKRYGQKRIKHRIFGKDGLKKFKFLVLRNSGSDFGKTHFRDVMMSSLLDDWDIEKQDYRPSHVYINGQYWGIYNIREKINRYFLADHADVDKDSIDIIEHHITGKRGTTHHYRKMLRFLRKHSLKESANFAALNAQMDIDNFMQYQIAQIYFDNRDAGGNIRFWRPQTPDGRWRWILYDTDWGFGLYDHQAYAFNSLNFHTTANGPAWPNPPWSTFILRKLLENEEFKHRFVNRFADHTNTTFSVERVVDKIDEFQQLYAPEIDRHFARWRLRESRWLLHINRMRKFAHMRPDYMRKHLMQKFNTGPLTNVALVSSKGGYIALNEYVKVGMKVFRGKYFRKIPISIEAIPNRGYRFSHWQGFRSKETSRRLDIDLGKEGLKVRAVFKKYNHPMAGKLIINEISCNNKTTGDWVELHNTSDKAIDISGWIFTDMKKTFTLPQVVIQPQAYFILCENAEAFGRTHPEQYDYIGNLGFGINKNRETLHLFSPDGAGVDGISYTLPPEDREFTFALLLPTLDNDNLENWEVQYGNGTPNAPNPYYLESHIRGEQKRWMRIGVMLAMFLIVMLLIRMSRR